MPIDLTTLNDDQRRAVLTTEGPLLVLAGPGSGKTRVTTYRVAHIVEQGHDPAGVVAIAFTNKSAAEMRHRVGTLLPHIRPRDMWVTTFHSMCLRILKASVDRLDVGKFTIFDDDDSKALIRAIVKDFDLDGHKLARVFRKRISEAKNALVTVEQFRAGMEEGEEAVADVYQAYQTRMRNQHALDFDDLLFETVNLLRKYPSLKKQYNDQFHHVHVDEYQDTNAAQYAIVQLLTERQNLMVVGDDDQSIYKFRGSDPRVIKDFMRDYPKAQVITLGQNYRSTARIVAVSKALIERNPDRRNKHLRTDNGTGDFIKVRACHDADDEAQYVVKEIQQLLNRLQPEQIAILYRTSAQSRQFETFLVRSGIPYVVVKGTAFFDRAEIKDTISLLRAVEGPRNDVALVRILTSTLMLKRGLGKTTLDKLAREAVERDMSLEEAMRAASVYGWDSIPTAGLKAMRNFITLLDELRQIASTEPKLDESVRRLIDRYSVIEALRASKAEDSEDRVSNVQEIANLAAEFEAGAGAEEAHDLSAFLEWIALQQGEFTGNGKRAITSATANAVKLMTMHAAKGLEFEAVFVVGVEEQTLPHFNALAAGDEGQIELAVAEERRLAYVALTRAKQILYMTHAAQRMVNGETKTRSPSRFLSGLPEMHLQHVTPPRLAQKPFQAPARKPWERGGGGRW